MRGVNPNASRKLGSEKGSRVRMASGLLREAATQSAWDAMGAQGVGCREKRKSRKAIASSESQAWDCNAQSVRPETTEVS